MILESLIVPLKVDDSLFKGGLEKAKGLAGSIGKGLGSALSIGAGAAVAGIGALTAATVGGMKAFTDYANELDGLADILGTTTEEGAGLSLMIKTIGGDSEQITKSMKFMANGLKSVDGGLGTTGKVLDKLGISFQNSDGTLKSSTEIFQSVSDVIGNMPDGLEKTNLMIDLFGKSGAELGDALAASANGGLAQFTAQAEQLGLVVGQDTVDASIQMQKSMETLKSSVNGLFVSIGAELIPIIAPLVEKFKEWAISVMPQVREGIAKVGEFITTQIVPVLKVLFDWIGQNLPPVMKFFADLWTNTIMPAQKAIWQFLQNNIVPILKQVFAWIGEHLPPVIKKLADFWNNTLLPAIKAIWHFLSVTMMPVWKLLADIIGTVIVGAIKILAGIWTNILQPALSAIWSWIKDKILPIFQRWSDALGGVRGVIDRIVGVLTTFRDALKSIKLPSWLTPGSPTPFEIGLRGIYSTLKDIDKLTNRMDMFDSPKLVTNTPGMGRIEPIQHNIISFQYQPTMSLADRYEAERVLKPFIETAVRGI